MEGPEALATAAEAEKPKHEKPAWGGGIAQARLGTLLKQSGGVSHVCSAKWWWIKHAPRDAVPQRGYAREGGKRRREACSSLFVILRMAFAAPCHLCRDTVEPDTPLNNL